jgi:hypothetical protein
MWLRWGIFLGAGAVGVRAANRRQTRPDILDEDIEGKGASFLISQISSLKAKNFVTIISVRSSRAAVSTAKSFKHSSLLMLSRMNPFEVDIIGMLEQGGFLQFAFAENATK